MFVCNNREFEKILKENGYEEKRIKGSHVTFSKPGEKEIITIPRKKNDLSPPLICRLLKIISKKRDAQL